MTTEKAPAYQWYPRDISASQRVALMTLAEEGAYRKALDSSWLEGSLPADPKQVADIIGKKCTVKMAELVLSMYVPDPKRPGRMINEKQEIIRRRQKKFSKSRSKAGKASAASRRKKKELAAQNSGNIRSTYVQRNVNSSSSSSSSTSNKKERESGHAKKGAALAVDAHDAKKFGFPITQLFKAFPKLQITATQLGMITSKVKEQDPHHAEAWTNTLEIYVANHNPETQRYAPDKVGNLLSVFKQELGKLERNGNGANKQIASTNAGERNANRIKEQRAIVDSLLAASEEESGVSG